MSKVHKIAGGYIDSHYYTHKTTFRDCSLDGFTKRQTLTRSFDTLEAAQKFAEGKNTLDIFRAKGRFKVQWVKETRFIYDENGNPVKT